MKDDYSVIDDGEYLEYHLNGRLHRANGPSATNKNSGFWFWSMRGSYHRYYGPAVKGSNWYLHGKCVKEYNK